MTFLTPSLSRDGVPKNVCGNFIIIQNVRISNCQLGQRQKEATGKKYLQIPNFFHQSLFNKFDKKGKCDEKGAGKFL